MVEFNYEIHDDTDPDIFCCPFCAITNFNGYDDSRSSPGKTRQRSSIRRKRSNSLQVPQQRKRSVSGSSSRGSSPGEEGSFNGMLSSCTSNVLQVPQRKRSISGSSRGSSPGDGSNNSSQSDQFNGISLQVPPLKRSCSGSSHGSSPGGSPAISRMNTMEEQCNYQSNGASSYIPTVLGSSPGRSNQRSSDNIVELNFQTYSEFAQGKGFYTSSFPGLT